MKRALLALPLFLCWAFLANAADDVKTGFVNRVYKDKDGEHKYVVFVPHDYKGDKAYPTILFLHGAGERGTDGEKPVKQGIGNAIKKHEKEFPFITVFPQAEKTWRADSDDGKRAMAILAEVEKDYKVDPKRVYLTGLSMGGAGTWSQAAEHPDKWAAIAPICGGGDPATAEKIKGLPVWAFCGELDAGPKGGIGKMTDALKKAGAEPKYTEYPGVGHNNWDNAYATKELYDWFLAQKKK